LLGTEYAISTAINACKWGAIRPRQNVYNIDDCVDHLKIAMTNKQKFRGHALVWGNHNPQWLENFSGSEDELDAILKDHIEYVVQNVPKKAGANKGELIAWDVVNEAIVDGKNGMYKTIKPWSRLPDYISKAFTYAREADPNVLLFYNDYSVIPNDNKANKIVEMIKEMQSK